VKEFELGLRMLEQEGSERVPDTWGMDLFPQPTFGSSVGSEMEDVFKDRSRTESETEQEVLGDDRSRINSPPRLKFGSSARSETEASMRSETGASARSGIGAGGRSQAEASLQIEAALSESDEDELGFDEDQSEFEEEGFGYEDDEQSWGTPKWNSRTSVSSIDSYDLTRE
jgi:hypothetical protein